MASDSKASTTEVSTPPNSASKPSKSKPKVRLTASVNSSRAGSPSTPVTAATTPTSAHTGKDRSNDAHHDGSKDPHPPAPPGTETQRCKHCGKQVPKEGFPIHSKQCMRLKKQKKQEKEQKAAEAAAAGVTGPGTGNEGEEPRAETPKTLNGATPKAADKEGEKDKGKEKAKASSSATKDTPTNAKKRKATDDTESGGGSSVAGSSTSKPPPPKKQKQKKETASTTAKNSPLPASTTSTTTKPATQPSGPGGKPKPPVDVERQCGVPLDNGGLCARSLTCKSHAMGAKRAVPGRSLPYDTLLAQYQRKNQARQQKAALLAANAAPTAADEALAAEGAAAPVDSDEERDAVMTGLGRAAPRPLGGSVAVPVSVRDRYREVRMREALANALGGNRGSGLFSIGARAFAGPAAATPTVTAAVLSPTSNDGAHPHTHQRSSSTSHPSPTAATGLPSAEARAASEVAAS